MSDKTGDTKDFIIDIPIKDIVVGISGLHGGASVGSKVIKKEVKKAIAKKVLTTVGSKFIPVVNAIVAAAYVAAVACEWTDTEGMNITVELKYGGIEYIGPGGSHTTQNEQWIIEDIDIDFY